MITYKYHVSLSHMCYSLPSSQSYFIHFKAIRASPTEVIVIVIILRKKTLLPRITFADILHAAEKENVTLEVLSFGNKEYEV